MILYFINITQIIFDGTQKMNRKGHEPFYKYFDKLELHNNQKIDEK
jgi:hypothetical protein